jgi:hypothetical protein
MMEGQCIYSDYFAYESICTPNEFGRRLTMIKEMFMKLVYGVWEYDDHFLTTKDCTGMWVFHLLKNALLL